MTTAEVAERLDVSLRTVTRWAEDGRLTPLRKSPLMFGGADVEKLAAELSAELAARLARLDAAS
jgi:transposase